jgi:hypothetical protein
MIHQKRRTICLVEADKFISKLARSRNSDNQSETVTKRLVSFFLLETVDSPSVSLVNRKKRQQFHHYRTIRMIYR